MGVIQNLLTFEITSVGYLGWRSPGGDIICWELDHGLLCIFFELSGGWVLGREKMVGINKNWHVEPG